MEIFTPYENASDMFVGMNITHFFNITSNYTSNIIYILNNTTEHMISGIYDGIYGTSYLFGLIFGVMCVFAPFVIWNESLNPSKKLNVTIIESDSNQSDSNHSDSNQSDSNQSDSNQQVEQPEPTFEEKYHHKFEHIIRFMNMFDYDCAEDKYFKIFNRTTIPINLDFKNTTEHDFAKLTQLIKVNKIENFDEVFYIIMKDDAFKMEDNMTQFYYLLYSDYLEDEFQDFRDMIVNLDC